MTYQEALNYLNNAQVDMKSIESMCEASSLIETCENALEKQRPKKPNLLKNELLLVAGWQYGCPNCGCACGENKYHEEVTDAEYYCTQCGQALDWSDIE